MELSGKVAIVTGSLSGIGRAIAIKLATLGARLVITGRDVKRVEDVVKRCRQVSNERAIGVKADLLVESEINNLVEQTVQEFGRIDILVNNAGVCTITHFGDSQYLTTYDVVMNTNVRSVQVLTQLVAPYLERSRGNVVNISSVSSMSPRAQTMAYCMAKCALDMFTQCLALELGPKGVRVNSISPAAITTPIFERGVGDKRTMAAVEKHCRQTYPLRRIGETIDIAEVVAFLVSDKASFVTGILMPVDGGSLRAPGSQLNYEKIINRI